MTYAQAKMIVWNHETYDYKKVKEGVVFILGCLNAKQEDLDQACFVLYLTRSNGD